MIFPIIKYSSIYTPGVLRSLLYEDQVEDKRSPQTRPIEVEEALPPAVGHYEPSNSPSQPIPDVVGYSYRRDEGFPLRLWHPPSYHVEVIGDLSSC